MKKLFITFIIIIILTIAFGNRDLRCQENPTIRNTQYHSNNIKTSTKDEENKDTIIDDKNLGGRILELIFKHNINQRYQKLYPEELEAMIEEQKTENR
jgi:hypothetical protein